MVRMDNGHQGSGLQPPHLLNTICAIALQYVAIISAQGLDLKLALISEP